jgi:lipopolysaccharide transport system permease protein
MDAGITAVGLAWFLASLGVVIRDINYLIGLIVQMLFFASAIFYAVEAIPEPFRTLASFNPLLWEVENIRRVVLWGQLPSWFDLGLWSLFGILLMLLGYAWFMKTKKAFADVI